MAEEHSYSIHIEALDMQTSPRQQLYQRIPIKSVEGKASLEDAIRYLVDIDDRLFNLNYIVSHQLPHCIKHASLINERNERIMTKQHYNTQERNGFPVGTYLHLGIDGADMVTATTMVDFIRPIEQVVGNRKNFLLLTEQQAQTLEPVFPRAEHDQLFLKRFRRKDNNEPDPNKHIRRGRK